MRGDTHPEKPSIFQVPNGFPGAYMDESSAYSRSYSLEAERGPFGHQSFRDSSLSRGLPPEPHRDSERRGRMPIHHPERFSSGSRMNSKSSLRLNQLGINLGSNYGELLRPLEIHERAEIDYIHPRTRVAD